MSCLLRTFAVCAAVLLVLSCSKRVERGGAGDYLPDDVDLRTGDVVLRRGNGLTSRAVLLIDKGSRYSHVGIVVDSLGEKMICHAVPGEHDGEGDIDRLRLCTPEVFFSAMRGDAGCVMRYADVEIARRAGAEALRLCKKGVPFDHDYDAEDSLKLYCSEFVELAYRKAGAAIVGEARHRHRSEGLHLERLLLPSDFRNSEYLHLLVEF